MLELMPKLIQNRYTNNFNVFHRAVELVFGLCGDLIDHFHTAEHLSEDGVVAIQEGCATEGGVNLALFLIDEFVTPSKCFSGP